MSDWADAEIKRLADEYWSGTAGDEFVTSKALLAAALRKAKADGMREAVEIILAGLDNYELSPSSTFLVEEAASKLETPTE